MKKENNLHHAIRIFLPEVCMKERIKEIIDYCRRTGCGEVWLFTSSYDQSPSFVSLQKISHYAGLMREAMAEFKAAGIEPLINVMQTLGHVYFPMELQDEFPFQRRVAANGRISHEGACPLCPSLREWVIESYRIYAELKPSVLWVDDDYRAVMQGLNCFCDLHLQRISDLAGRKVSREELVDALKQSTWPVSELRKYFYEVNTAGMCELAEVIRETVHAISPETRIGLMTAAPPMAELGMNIAKVAKTLAGESRPLLRPQIPMYSEDFMRNIPKALLATDQLRSVQPEATDYCPEIENYIYSSYSNSAQFTFLKAASQVLLGFDNLGLNIFSHLPVPCGLTDPQAVDMLEKRKVFLNRLHQLIPENSRPGGISLFRHPDAPLNYRVKADASDSIIDWVDSKTLANHLPVLGLPVAWGLSSPWVFLSGDDVLGMNEEELDSLLKSGAVMDVRAAEALSLRGFGARIGVKVGTSVDLDDVGYEYYHNSVTSDRFCGQSNSLHAISIPGEWKYISGTAPVNITASSIINFRGKEIAPVLLLTENENGERFAVLACDGNGSRKIFENPTRVEQLRNTFAWVARKPLPLAIPETFAYLWPIINKTHDGRMIAGIINLSTDTYSEFCVLWGLADLPENIHILRYDGQLEKVAYKANGNELTLKCRMVPLDLAVIIFD